jgi:misacylated tRNA(Ala) deacylase
MTEKLYLNDSYLKEIEGRINSVNENGITLDRTVFYARGGGQPGDSGSIVVNGKTFEIIETVKEGNEVLHVIENEITQLKEGDHCLEKLDWEKRYSHMKYHTAIHLIDGIVNKMPDYAGLITGSQIYEDRTRVDFSMENFSTQLAEEIIETVNRAIKEKHQIKIKYLTSEEAESRPNLARTEPGRELIKKLDIVRVIEIEGIDEQADGGTHVNNTEELGQVVLQRIENKGKRNKRLYFTLAL